VQRQLVSTHGVNQERGSLQSTIAPPNINRYE